MDVLNVIVNSDNNDMLDFPYILNDFNTLRHALHDGIPSALYTITTTTHTDEHDDQRVSRGFRMDGHKPHHNRD